MRCLVDDGECVTGRLKRGLCEKHYRRLLKTGSTESTRLDPFVQFTVVTNGCHQWTGAKWRNGYGKTSVITEGTRLAHRAFYLHFVGPIPDGLDIDHTCHNADITCSGGVRCLHRLCVNVEHLKPATRGANLNNALNTRAICEAGLHDLTLPGAVRSGTHQCVECWRIRYRRAAIKYRAKKH